jgi:signal transduction histidine kinase
MGECVRTLSRVAGYLTDSPTRIAVSAAVVFVLAGAAKYFAVAVLWHFHAERWFLRGQDVVLTGLLASGFVATLLAAFGSRRRYVLEQVRLAAMLNHEVRNALEVILGSDYLPESEQTQAVMQSVDRINRTLNGLLQPNARKL